MPAPKSPCDAVDEALVRLAPDGVERERAVAGGVIADRGHAALRDRELESERALERDHLRPRRPCRQEPGRGRGSSGPDRAGAARPESRQE